MFQHTATRRRLPCNVCVRGRAFGVSTHSRPKAAACVPSVYAISVFLFQHTAARRRLHHVFVVPDRIVMFQHTAARRRLPGLNPLHCHHRKFQHTAARRRLLAHDKSPWLASSVSTHSRPKAAALLLGGRAHIRRGFNTQPPEGGCTQKAVRKAQKNCFNTQPPEGGCQRQVKPLRMIESFNTQPPEGGCD